MQLSSRTGRGLAAAVAVAVVIVGAGAAGPAQAVVDIPEPAAARRSSEALRGLSAERPGRVAASAVRADGVLIAPRVQAADSLETAVAPAARLALAPRLQGVIDDAVLAGEVASWFHTVGDCRLEAAHEEDVPIRSIAAAHITLRWVITASGSTRQVEVVATTPTDPLVLLCVKQKMLGWMFTRPAGGPLAVERGFSFRTFPDAPLDR